jgi:hypothetical protein
VPPSNLSGYLAVPVPVGLGREDVTGGTTIFGSVLAGVVIGGKMGAPLLVIGGLTVDEVAGTVTVVVTVVVVVGAVLLVGFGQPAIEPKPTTNAHPKTTNPINLFTAFPSFPQMWDLEVAHSASFHGWQGIYHDAHSPDLFPYFPG